MAKFRKKLAEVIIELIEKDMTVTEVCNAVGIARKTFYEWKNDKPEFARMIDEAQDRCYDELITLARRTLRDRIEGYTVEETTYTYEPSSYDENEMILKKKVVKQKRKEATVRELNLLIDKTRDKKEKRHLPNLDNTQKKGLIYPRNSEEAIILFRFYQQLEKQTTISDKKATS